MALRLSRSIGTALFGTKFAPYTTQVRTFIYEVVPLDPKVSLRLDLNVLKEAAPIEEKADAEYPEWLFNVTTAHPTMYEMNKMDKDEFKGFMLRRYFKLTRKNSIKDANRVAKK